MKNGHIITCKTKEDFELFINNGYAGLEPIPVNGGSIPRKIGTNWDIIADLKRLKPGDYIFLHVKGEKTIYGPFQSTTYFLESPNMPKCFKSKNIRESYWDINYSKPVFSKTENTRYPWRVGIKAIEKIGKINSMELFKLRSTGLIHSIPQRWMYHDKPKIVKPLLTHEVSTILELLSKKRDNRYTNVKAQSLSEYNKICLDLNFYKEELYREKILEAWFMENIECNQRNELAHKEIINIFEKAEHYVNTIFTYYTNFMDILFYDETSSKKEEFCEKCGRYTSKNKTNLRVIELKKGRVSKNDLLQVKGYEDWTTKVLANGDHSKVTTFLVGRKFTNNLTNQNNVNFIKYDKDDEDIVLEKIN